MMKFNLLICTVFVTLHFGNSLPHMSDFGKFFGGCPQVISIPERVLENTEEEWFTHRVMANYSPWKYLKCQSNKFQFRNDGSSTVKTRFAFPFLPTSFELVGNLDSVKKGEYTSNYHTGIFSGLSQKIAVLQTYNAGEGALIWTCSDFIFFHLESIKLITKSKSSSPNNKEYIFRLAYSSVSRMGLSPEDLVPIDQSC